MIDSHTHLDRGPAPEAELVAEARAAGVTRILTIGMDEESCAAALRAAEAHEEVFARGRPAPERGDRLRRRSDGLRELRRSTRTCAAIGETGLDDFRDYAPRADQERAFADQIALAREVGKPLVIHTRAAEDDTIARWRARPQGLEVILHCFSMPSRLEECLDHGWWISFAGNVTYPKAADLAEAAEQVAARPDAGRDRRAVPDAAGRAQGAQPAGLRRPHRALHRRAPRASPTPSWTRRSRRTLPSSSAGEPAAQHPPRMREFGVRPNRELGQNFLVDSNILDVIGRLAELDAEDVVLEVGGGLGVLSEYLAERVAHVHVVEIDRGLEPPLRDALDPHANTTLHFADAVKLDLDALDPAPTKVVANLPYGVAATVILRTIELPRRAHLGGDGAEGGRRALRGRPVDLGLRRPVRARPARVRRARGRARSRATSSIPVPNVDSVLVGLKRHSPAPPASLRDARPARLRAPPQGARAVARARPGAAPDIRDRTREALEAIGKPADARAESLSPAEWRALWERLC